MSPVQAPGSTSVDEQTTAMLELVLANSAMGLGFVDRDYRFVFVNESLAAMNGPTVAEHIGRTVAEVVPDLWPQIEGMYRRVLEGEPSLNLELSRSTPAAPGAFRHWLVSCHPATNPGGAVIGIGVIVVETTKKATERKLFESEERFRATFEQAAVGIALAGMDHRFLRVNPKLCQILGYSEDELLDLTFDEITEPEDMPACRSSAETLIAAELPAVSLEKRYRRKDGTPVLASVTISLVRDVDGRPKHFIAVIEDIDSRRQMETELRQAQKMEAVGRLAGGVAHDLNNILTVILGYAEMALRALPEGDPMHSNMVEVEKAGKRAAALTSDLLVFSRKQVVRPTVLDVNRIVDGTIRMLERLIGEDVRMTTSLAGDLGMVKADAGQIEQVVMNLALNARDAMPGGGNLRIETTNVTLDREDARRLGHVEPGAYVALIVSDTGVGMNAETKAQLFEPFFTTKERGKGTGFGLSTVYGIVTRWGGGIRVQSEPGAGSVFQIYLPRTDEAAATRASGAAVGSVAAGRGSERILLVEDEEMVRELTHEVLAALGYDVVDAVDGDQALELCRASGRAFDLVVTDLVMPGKSGRELAETLLELGLAKRVLYMSGYTQDVFTDQRLPADTAFIEKPFKGSALAAKVREVLDARPKPVAAPARAGSSDR